MEVFKRVLIRFTTPVAYEMYKPLKFRLRIFGLTVLINEKRP